MEKKSKTFKRSKSSEYDDTSYWDWICRRAEKRDIGHQCRECKKTFTKLGESISVRRGGRIELKYHDECFSGYSDPRSQVTSSYHAGKFNISNKAPKLTYNKMRTATHW
jgi:hypothetical protein